MKPRTFAEAWAALFGDRWRNPPKPQEHTDYTPTAPKLPVDLPDDFGEQ